MESYGHGQPLFQGDVCPRPCEGGCGCYRTSRRSRIALFFNERTAWLMNRRLPGLGLDPLGDLGRSRMIGARHPCLRLNPEQLDPSEKTQPPRPSKNGGITKPNQFSRLAESGSADTIFSVNRVRTLFFMS